MPLTGMPGTPGSFPTNTQSGIPPPLQILPIPGGYGGTGTFTSLPNTVITPTTITVYSSILDPFAQCLNLWNTSTSSNNPPPANWYSNSFDHSSWQQTVEADGAHWAGGTNRGPSYFLWSQFDDPYGVDQCLFFDLFNLPSGITITSANVFIFANNECLGFYINDTLISGSIMFGNCSSVVQATLNVPITLLTPGTNSLAGNGHNLCLGAEFGWTITINYKNMVAQGTII